MTKFEGGPAHGVVLMLTTSPKFLRAVKGPVFKKGNGWDALNHDEDSVRGNETPYAYQLVKDDGGAFVDFAGPRRGGFFKMATYAYLPVQPAMEILRNNDRWHAWCYAQEEKHQETTEGPGPEAA